MSETKSSQPYDVAAAEVEALLSDVPFRQPIVDDYIPAVHDAVQGEPIEDRLNRMSDNSAKVLNRDAGIDREWLILTESARQSILDNPAARSAITGFAGAALNEKLPEEAVIRLAQEDQKVAQIFPAKTQAVASVLSLDEVPDKLIKPDIMHAPALIRKQDELKPLARSKQKDDPEIFASYLEQTVERINNAPGLTKAEKELIARRYRFARDIKLLTLMAELHDDPVKDTEPDSPIIEHTIKSGTKMAMTREAFKNDPSLLDPRKWQSRRQLKDRVFTVRIDDKDYVLKERKTSRHTDVKRGGHRDGLTSQQEFEVASKFAALGTIQEGDVKVRWEKPLGYVEFPDGYQFSLFEHERALSTTAPVGELANSILNDPKEFTDEFAQISEEAKQIYHQRDDLIDKFDPFAQEDEAPDELKVYEFAELKANALINQATELLSAQMRELGFTNSDTDGFGYVVHQGKRPTLEIIGFDFEYYSYSPKHAEGVSARIKKLNESGEWAKMLSRPVADRRAITTAASYAMFRQMGYNLPPISN